MGWRTEHAAVTKQGKGFYTWPRDERIPLRENISPAAVAARKRIEDIKLAKELGIPLEELCRT